MKQKEMSKYLKLVTIGIALLFLVLAVWFMPVVLKNSVKTAAGNTVYQILCIFLWLTTVPCFFSLWKFWGICTRIGKDLSFSRENAEALKQISHFMLADAGLYAVVSAVTVLTGWYEKMLWLLFAEIVILFLCISLTVLSAALSHLVYKASRMQEDQDLTI